MVHHKESHSRGASSYSGAVSQSVRSAAVSQLENAVARFQAILTDDERKRLKGLKKLPHDAQSIIVFTAELDMQQAENRRGKSIASRLTSFLQIQQFTPAIEIYIQSNPDITALIWGSIKLTFMILFKDSIRLNDSICEFHAAVIVCYEKIFLIIRESSMRNQIWNAITHSFQTEIQSYVEAVKTKAENAQREVELAKAQTDYQEQQQQTKERQKASEYREKFSAWTVKYGAAIKDLQDLKEKQARDQRRRGIIRELSSYNFMPTFNNMRNKRHIGTAEWCFQTQQYQEWVEAKKSAILHITGKINWVWKDDPGMGDYLEQARSSMFSVESLILLFTIASKNLDDWYIVIDGLDEIDVPRQIGMLKFLRQVLDQVTEPHRIKLLLSSRETSSTIIDRIIPDAARLNSGLQPTSADIRVYTEDIVRDRIATNELIVSDPDLVTEIVAAIHQKEQGMFLWAFLTIEDICSRKCDKDIRQALKDIPVDLPATFDRTLGRIERKKHHTAIVEKAFTLIKASFEPLTLSQLREALSVEIGQQTLDNEDLISVIDRLPTWCENLSCVEEADTVHFSHHSIHQYLLTPGSGDFQNFHLPGGKCNQYMGELCVTYINLDNFQRALGFRTRSNTEKPLVEISIDGLAEQTMQTAVKDTIGSRIGRLTREAVMASRSNKASTSKVPLNEAVVSSLPKHNCRPVHDTGRYTFFEYASGHWFEHPLCIDSREREVTWRLLGQLLRRPRQSSQDEPWYNPSWRRSVSEIIDNDVLVFGPGFGSCRETAVSLDTEENARLMKTSSLQDLCLVFIYAIQKHNGGLACRVFMLLLEDYKSPSTRRLHGYLRIIINRRAVNKSHEICRNQCLSRARLQLNHVDLVRELRTAVASGISYFPRREETEAQ
ncbi:heterokaryon incompatibility protein het-E-1 [Fusarium beomiforme]|uniref:Heterokaryon incompatibility protein het-E-1 n=1 Tax=Fusarium beomiforme TaxID=44412 RepID=A0A9P5ARU1_9HYPO|nr:heterokaryon incompatibility protein het-E-1 [Fusarium beomiforme]